MKKAELIIIGLALLALVLKLLHLEGANLLIVLSFSSLATLYFCLGFALFNSIPFRRILKKESYKGISTLRMVGAIGAGTFLSQTLIGILFGLLKWEGAFIMLQIGLAGLAFISVVGLVRYSKSNSKSKSHFYLNLFKRVALFGALGLLLRLM